MTSTRLLVVAGTLVTLVPNLAVAKSKPYCRDLVFSGAAGAASNDIVTLRVVDQAGSVLDESCPIQVHNNETARAFAARITGAWGDGTGGSCTEPAPLPAKSCGNALFGGRSCKHQYKFKADKHTIDPDDGLIRIRVCCKDTPNCKGTNLTNSPISVQTKKAPEIMFGPAVPPVVGIDITPVSVDPIALIERPHAALQSCRKELSKVVAGAGPKLLSAVVQCRSAALRDEAAPDCTTLTTEDSKVIAADQGLHEGLAEAVARGCAGLPGDYGYLSCPVPCSALPVGTWPDLAECLACAVENAILDATNDAYGNPGPAPPLAAEDLKCQDTVGDVLDKIVGTDVREIVKCQQGADAGNLSPPDGTFCKDADLKGKRAATASKGTQLIVADCTNADLVNLESCGLEESGEATCIVEDVAPTASAAIADALFPEGASPSGAFLDTR